MIPLLPQQQAIYFFEKLKPGTSTYHRSFVATLNGKVDLDCLQQAIGELQLRHPILHASIIDQNGEPVFDDSKIQAPPIFFHDLSKINAPATDQVANFLKEQDGDKILHAPFDLNNGPLWRCAYLQYANGQSQLIFIFHDIIVDNHSIELITQHLSELYNAKLEQRVADLPNVPQMWYLSEFEDEHYLEKIDYWKQNLKDLSLLPLIPDYPQKTEFNFLGDRCYFNLDANLSAACRDLAKTHDVTVESVILTALFILLYRHTNEADLCIGTLTTNRANFLVDVEHVISSFTNSLPIRLQIPEQTSFSQLVKEVESTVKAANQNELPVNEVVHFGVSNDVKAGMNFSLPFKVLCGFDRIKPGLNLKNTSSTPLFELGLKHTKFENFGVKFQLQQDGSYACFIEFNTELFKKETMEALAARLKLTVINLITAPNKDINDISFLIDEEKNRINEFYHSSEKQTPTEDYFHQNFSRIARLNPNRIAVVFHDVNNKMRYLTYKELERKTNQLAAYLQNCGVTAEKTVGVCITRSLDLIVSVIAILKAGGVVVPLETSADSDTLPRIEYKINDALLDTILVDDSTEALFNAYGKSVFRLNVQKNEYESVVSQLGLKYETPKLVPHNLAYIAYTSGTTGEPKGVMIEHASFINLAHAVNDRRLPIKGNVLASAPLTFDCFFWELLEWLSTKGGQLHLINEKERLSTLVQERVIHDYQINCATLLPPLLINLNPDNVPSLIDIISMGAVPHLDTLSKWYEAGRTIRNEYGPTEATICSTENPYDPSVTFTSIGVPIRNAQILVLDDHLKHRPINAPGKIYIGGAGLARGYVGRNALTTHAFPMVLEDKNQDGYIKINPESINQPSDFPTKIEKKPRKKRRLDDNSVEIEPKRNKVFTEQNKFLRFYDTGDVGCYVLGPDKKIRINFLGRCDRQVKINGVRIELDGIETIIRKHPGIADVHLSLNQNKDGLIAYIVPKPEHDISQTILDEHLQDTFVPSIAHPNTVVLLEKLPITKNGKVDTKALPHPSATPVVNKPSTPLQEQLCQIWCQVLNRDEIDVKKSFRDLGGTSIALVILEFQLHQKLKISSQFGITMLNRDITIEDLENLLKSVIDQPSNTSTQNSNNSYMEQILPYTFHGSSKRIIRHSIVQMEPQVKNKL